MKLSIALAIFNEEAAIARCLDSVYELADEIVVVDGGSTDKTLEIVKRQDKDSKVKIFHEDNPPMFHINKQKAIEKCKGDWILQLDADEVVSSELAKEITVILSETKDLGVRPDLDSSATPQNDNVVAYWIPRLNYFLGKPLHKGGQYPDHTIRLYQTGKAKFPCKTVHEQVDVDGKIGYLHENLLHYPYATFASYVDKWVRYSVLEATENYQKGIRPSPVNFLKYMILYPKLWFLKTYFRHKGFMDGFPGFVFSLFSSLRYWVEYIVLYERERVTN